MTKPNLSYDITGSQDGAQNLWRDALLAAGYPPAKFRTTQIGQTFDVFSKFLNVVDLNALWSDFKTRLENDGRTVTVLDSLSVEKYSVASDTLNGTAIGKRLLKEVCDDSSTPDCHRITISGDDLLIEMGTALDAAEKTALDGLVAAHDGTPTAKPPKFHAASKIVEDEKAITEITAWQDLGGARTTVGFFVADVTKAIGQIVGDVKTVGVGVKLRLVKGDPAVAISAEFAPGDTGGAWTALEFQTNAAPDAASQVYRLQGKLEGASSASIRFCSMSLLELP